MYYIISLYYKNGESSIDTVDDDDELTLYLLRFISNYFKSDDADDDDDNDDDDSKGILKEYKDVYKYSKKIEIHIP